MSKTERKVRTSLAQVFLPFHDITTDESGWQFGLPPRTTMLGPEARLAEKAGLSILKLYEDGETEIDPHPIRRAPHYRTETTEPPSPQWAWVPVPDPNKEGCMEYACVVAPTQSFGSVPLHRLPGREPHGKVVYTPYGIDIFRGDKPPDEFKTLYDTPHDVRIDLTGVQLPPDADVVEVDIPLGNTNLGAFVVSLDEPGQPEGDLLYVKPSDFCYAQALWTCHLLRVIESSFGDHL